MLRTYRQILFTEIFIDDIHVCKIDRQTDKNLILDDIKKELRL